MTHHRLFLALPCLLALLACDESADLATGEIRAAIEIDVNHERGTLKVILHKEQETTRVPLSGGDQLRVTTDVGDDVVLVEGAGSGYEALISPESRTVTVTLERPSQDNAQMTVDVAEVADVENTTFSQRDEAITLTWTNPDEDTQVTVFVDSCALIELETREWKPTIPDTGSFTLTKAELEAEAGITPDCARLELLRRHYRHAEEGELFHPFSFITARRYQNFEITLTP